MDSMITTIVAGEHIYGIAAVTTQLVEAARRTHGASPTAIAALGRLLTGGVLMAALLKEPSHRWMLQITSRGPVRKIVVEANGAGHVRGYLGQATISVPSRNGKLDVGKAVGKGILHVIKDAGLPKPSSGTIPLVSGEIAEDLAAYFQQSEQIPSAASLGVFVGADHTVTAAGGFLIQFHSTVADDLVEHIERALTTVPAVTTMIREGHHPYDMLQQALGGLPLEIVRHITPWWHCRCSRDRVVHTLVALGAEELRHLVGEATETRIRCEFCATEYRFTPQELSEVLDSATG